MASNDSRKNTEEIVGQDKTPKVNPELTADTVSNPVAVKGTEDQAKTGSTEDKLAAAIKSEGVDLVRVWDGGDNHLFYAEMHKNGVKRLLSVDHRDVEDSVSDAAKSLVAQARFDKATEKAQEEVRKSAR